MVATQHSPIAMNTRLAATRIARATGPRRAWALRVVVIALVGVSPSAANAVDAGLEKAYGSTPCATALRGAFGFGLALADIDHDSFKDLVVSTGNDWAPRALEVYFQEGASGLFGSVPVLCALFSCTFMLLPPG